MVSEEKEERQVKENAYKASYAPAEN